MAIITTEKYQSAAVEGIRNPILQDALANLQERLGKGAAEAYRRLIDDFGHTQERLAQDAAERLKVPLAELPARVGKLLEERKEAQKQIDDLKADFARANLAVVAQYKGLSVAQVTGLRTELRKVDGRFKVIKNTLARRAAAEAEAAFEERFRHGRLPEDMPQVTLAGGEDGLPVAQMLKQAGLTASTTEAVRMIEQGGVRLDGARLEDRALRIARGRTVVAQVGKRKVARITVT